MILARNHRSPLLPPNLKIGFPSAQLSSWKDSLDCLDRASLHYRHSRLRCHTADLNCTRLAGLEPCVYLRNLVRETGLEPVRPKTGDFKSPVATITPLSHIWYQELDSNQPHLVLQTSALPDELSWHNILWGDYWELNPDKRNHNPRLYH